MKLKSNAQIARENAAKRAEQDKGKKKGKVRYVRTAAGEKRFGRSIGDVIVAGEKMENIKHEDPVYPAGTSSRARTASSTTSARSTASSSPTCTTPRTVWPSPPTPTRISSASSTGAWTR